MYTTVWYRSPLEPASSDSEVFLIFLVFLHLRLSVWSTTLVHSSIKTDAVFVATSQTPLRLAFLSSHNLGISFSCGYDLLPYFEYNFLNDEHKLG